MMLDVPEKDLHNESEDQEVVLSIKNLSKRFCRDLKRSLLYGVQDIAGEVFGSQRQNVELRKGEFWALKDVNLELRRGEALGLVGANGAGKTTLLRIISGLIAPDHGSVEIKGRVAPLIALGAGFNPILTGRENIYVNMSILGLSKEEIDDRFEEVVAFAEIGEAIDAPVQSYSSGMNVRLGFGVAAVLIKPDILLLDEVLAVGDIGFTIKCLNKVRYLAKNSAIVFVSHSMQFVSAFCTDILLMKDGSIVYHSNNVAQGIDAYMSLFNKNSINHSGTNEANIVNIKLFSCHDSCNSDNQELIIDQGSSLTLEFEIINKLDSKAEIVIYIMDASLQAIVCYRFAEFKQISKGRTLIDLDLENLDLNAGRYSFTFVVMDSLTKRYTCRLEGVAHFRIKAPEFQWGYIVRSKTSRVKLDILGR